MLALHNFLLKSQSSTDNHYAYCSVDLVDRESRNGRQAGQWRSKSNTDGLVPLVTQGSHNYTRHAKDVRENFKNYFNSEVGAVSWQKEHVSSTTNPFDEAY